MITCFLTKDKVWTKLHLPYYITLNISHQIGINSQPWYTCIKCITLAEKKSFVLMYYLLLKISIKTEKEYIHNYNVLKYNENAFSC